MTPSRFPARIARRLALALLVLLPAGARPAEAPTPVGPGSRQVSINFHDAPLVLVLDYLAALTGKSVMAAPGLGDAGLHRHSAVIVDLIERRLQDIAAEIEPFFILALRVKDCVEVS